MRPTRRPPGPATRRGTARAVGVAGTVLACALALFAASCAGGSDVKQHPAMTEQQAAAHANQIIHDTAAALSPAPRLEVNQNLTYTGPCLDDTNPQAAQGLVVVARGYWLRGIPPGSNATIGEQVLRFWRQKNWVITSTQGIGTSSPQIIGIAKPYAFRINLLSSDNGWLSIGATSVCISPSSSSPGQ